MYPVMQSCPCQCQTTFRDDVAKRTFQSEKVPREVEVGVEGRDKHTRLSPRRPEFMSRLSVTSVFLNLTTWFLMLKPKGKAYCAYCQRAYCVSGKAKVVTSALTHALVTTFF